MTLIRIAIIVLALLLGLRAATAQDLYTKKYLEPFWSPNWLRAPEYPWVKPPTPAQPKETIVPKTVPGPKPAPLVRTRDV